MKRIIIALLLLSLCSTDASACLFSRVKARAQQRREVRKTCGGLWCQGFCR
jgi:hypothetical protein